MMHILIVDDDEDDREMFCEAVHDTFPNVNCLMARDGEEALKNLRLTDNPKPRMIFLDLNMPRVNGVQCLNELKKDSTLRDIPVVIYTTSKLDEDREQTKRLGAIYFVTKPSTYKELCNRLVEILDAEIFTAEVTKDKT